jgi:hypothetical protein
VFPQVNGPPNRWRPRVVASVSVIVFLFSSCSCSNLDSMSCKFAESNMTLDATATDLAELVSTAISLERDGLSIWTNDPSARAQGEFRRACVAVTGFPNNPDLKGTPEELSITLEWGSSSQTARNDELTKRLSSELSLDLSISDAYCGTPAPSKNGSRCWGVSRSANSGTFTLTVWATSDPAPYLDSLVGRLFSAIRDDPQWSKELEA